MRQNVNGNPFSIYADKKEKSGREIYRYFINRHNRAKWFDVDSVDQGQNKNPNSSLSLLIDKNIINLWMLLLFLGLSILLVRVAYLQIFQSQHFSAIADGNRIRVLDVKATRGVIYDRHRNLLVENVPGFSLVVIPVDLNKDEKIRHEIANELAKISKKSSAEIFQIIQNQSPYSYAPVIIEEPLNQEQAIAAEIISSKYSGVSLNTDSVREYLLSSNPYSLSHVLGYPGRIEPDNLEEYLNKNYSIDDFVGKTGIELAYESELKGVNGRQQIEVDATGEAKEIIAYKEPIPGNNLVLTIDAELQDEAERSLSRVLRAHNKKRGAVVVLDPNSGEVLALVSLPAFDNNAFSQGIGQEEFNTLINNPDRPLFSRAISGEYPSGSIFKLIVGVAALQEDLITDSFGVNSVGGIQVSRWFFPDWKFGGHGWTNIAKAIAQSVNTFFYTIGGGYNDFEGLGVARIREYAEKFGLNNKLGIDLPNEASGFLPSKDWKEEVKQERWYIGDTYNLSIGQGDILVTPLQVAVWTSVFANDGTLFKPYLVKEFLDESNNVLKEVEPEILNKNFIDPENLLAINRGLRQAVTDGSATRLYDLPISVAAKTGTAQWSSKNPPHAWLTAYAPYNNPQIVVTVLVEEGIGGTTTAMPVAYDILNWWANNR